MSHPTHKLKAYTGDANKPCVFCVECGKEEVEGLEEPCSGEIYVKKEVDTSKEPK